jgi:hypothetical protein
MDQQRSQNGCGVFPARSFSANAYRIHRSKVTSGKISRMRKKATSLLGKSVFLIPPLEGVGSGWYFKLAERG